MGDEGGSKTKDPHVDRVSSPKGFYTVQMLSLKDALTLTDVCPSGLDLEGGGEVGLDGAMSAFIGRGLKSALS